MNSATNQHSIWVDGCLIERCPQVWSNLMPTESEDVRFCAACWKKVHLAHSPEQLHDFAEKGMCVALAYEQPNGKLLGRTRLPKVPLEHSAPELFAAISRHKTGAESIDDLRFIALCYLKHLDRNESLRFLRLLIEAGGKPDAELIISANRLGIDATDPAPPTSA